MTHKAQGALTAVFKKEKQQQQQIDKQWKQYRKRLIKLVKSITEIEHLNPDNVLKSTQRHLQVLSSKHLWLVR